MRTRPFILALALLLGAAPAAEAKRPKPLKAPSFGVELLTRDQVGVLESGVFSVRVTARRTASVRLRALVDAAPRPAELAPAQTFRFRARTRRRATFRLKLSPAARRALTTCFTTRITLVVKARGYGSPGLRTRRRTKVRERRVSFVCRDGQLVVEPSRSGGSGGGGRPGSGPGAAPRGPSYWMGVGAASIAPGPDGRFNGQKVFLGGYGLGGDTPAGEGRSATGVLGDGPMVRATAIGDGEDAVLLVNLETQGWFADTRRGPGLIDMRRAVVAALGGKDAPITAQQVIIQSDHSHAGADPMGVWGGVPTDFMEFMGAQARRAMLEAYVNRRPGRLFYGAVNGRDLLSNQFDYDERNKVLDDEVRVLQARDESGTPFATLLNFSAHSTVLGSANTNISGDWPQAANQLLEQRFGGRAMTMIGTFGRTQPGGRGDSTCAGLGDGASQAFNLCKIDFYGRQVVDRAAQAADTATEIPAGDPKVDARSYLITDPSTNAPILGLEAAGEAIGAPFNRSLAPPWQEGNVIGTTTFSALIGDVLVSGGPGEMYPQIPLKVRDTAPGLRGYMTAGLAGDQLGYLIAPFEAYPEPIRRTFFTEEGVTGDSINPQDQAGISPISNDNYFFNVSHTMGERVTCSLLRGAGELTGRPELRGSYERCALFPNDSALPPGSDDALAP